MKQQRPFFLSFIGYFYVFGAFVLIITLFSPQEPDIGMRFGLLDAPQTPARLLLAGLALVMAYGYLRMARWGFWLMVAYSAWFLFISLELAGTNGEQPYLGNAVWSAVVLAYTIWQRKCFLSSPQG